MANTTETRRPRAAAAMSDMFAGGAILLSETHARQLIARASSDLPRSGKIVDGEWVATEPADITQIVTVSKNDAGKTKVSYSEQANTEYQPVGKIAVIAINGILCKDDYWWGMASTSVIIRAIDSAKDDRDVAAIVLDIDSPGGYVNGTVELADYVRAAKSAKPITAVIRGYCCSGAYWIASQAGSIITRPESFVGNIGVYSVLSDWTKALDDFGVSLTLVASGQFKGLGADMKVSQDYIDETARINSGLYQQFVEAVATGRNINLANAMKLSDGRAYLGSEALTLKLVDTVVSSMDSAIEIVIGAIAPEGTAAMAKKPATPAAELPRAAEDEDKETVSTPSNEDACKVLDATISSATAHTAQARAAKDTANTMSEDLEDDTKQKAAHAAAALNTCAEESSAAAKMWLAKAGNGEGDEDQEEDDPEKEDTDGKPGDDATDDGGSKNTFTVDDYKGAFGDSGFKLFHSEPDFAKATRQYVSEMRSAHRVEIDAANARIADLTTRLAAIDRGNDPASFTSDEDAGGESQAKRMDNKAPHIARFAQSIKLPGRK